MLVSAVEEIGRSGRLIEDGLKTGDEPRFSQALTHFRAGKTKFEELEKLIDLRAEGGSESSTGIGASDLWVKTDELISAKCTEEWPDDHRMQLHCKNSQEKGLEKLRKRDRYTVGINSSIFDGIRAKCREEWPSDFSMRDHCEERQIEAYTELHSSNK